MVCTNSPMNTIYTLGCAITHPRALKKEINLLVSKTSKGYQLVSMLQRPFNLTNHSYESNQTFELNISDPSLANGGERERGKKER